MRVVQCQLRRAFGRTAPFALESRTRVYRTVAAGTQKNAMLWLELVIVCRARHPLYNAIALTVVHKMCVLELLIAYPVSRSLC